MIEPQTTQRLHSSSFLGLPYRILDISYKKGTTVEPMGISKFWTSLHLQTKPAGRLQATDIETLHQHPLIILQYLLVVKDARKLIILQSLPRHSLVVPFGITL